MTEGTYHTRIVSRASPGIFWLERFINTTISERGRGFALNRVRGTDD